MKVCLFPTCEEQAKSRGLCDNHYANAHAYVKRGLTSWAWLEDHGKCRPTVRDKIGEAQQWFLREEA